MNLVLHLVQKDVRRSKWSLAFWLFVAALPVLWGLLDALLSGKDAHLHAVFLNLYFRSTWVQALLVILMAGILMRDELPASTTAFWLTRPISKGTLLSAKALLMGFFLVLLPILSQTFLLALQGATAGELAYAALELGFRLSESIVLAWVLASVLPQSWFLVAAALVFPLQWLAGWWILAWKTLNLQAPPPFRATALIVTDSIVVGALTLLFGAGLLFYQYQTRDTRRTVYMGLAALTLLYLVQPLWKWDLQKPSLPVEKADSISLSLGRHRVTRDAGGWGSPQPVMDYWGDVEINGRAPGEDIRVVGLSTSLGLPDGHTLKDEGYDLYANSNWIGQPDTQAVQRLLGPVKLLNPEKGWFPTTHLLTLDAQWYRRFFNRPVSYSADAYLVRVKYQVEGEIPLTPGAGFRQGSRSATILDAAPSTNGFEVNLQDQNLDLAFKRDPAVRRSVFITQDGVFYLLENKKRGEAFLPNRQSMNLSVDLHEAKQPIRLAKETVQFSPTPVAAGLKNPLDQDWLKDAVLVRVRMEPCAEFHKKLEVKAFSLAENDWPAQPYVPMAFTYGLGMPSIEAFTGNVADPNALPRIRGRRLESKGKTLLLDDFEHGDALNKLSAFWYALADTRKLGTVLTPLPFKPQPGGCPASPNFAAHIQGHWGKEQSPWPFAYLGCGFNLKYDYVDLSDFSAFRFYSKGDGRPYVLKVERASISDFGYEESGFTAPPDWTQITLPFSGFNQPPWAKQVPPGWQDVRQIEFSPDASIFSDEDFDLWVDQIELVK